MFHLPLQSIVYNILIAALPQRFMCTITILRHRLWKKASLRLYNQNNLFSNDNPVAQSAKKKTCHSWIQPFGDAWGLIQIIDDHINGRSKFSCRKLGIVSKTLYKFSRNSVLNRLQFTAELKEKRQHQFIQWKCDRTGNRVVRAPMTIYCNYHNLSFSSVPVVLIAHTTACDRCARFSFSLSISHCCCYTCFTQIQTEHTTPQLAWLCRKVSEYPCFA